MSSSTKKGKGALVEFDNQTKEIRQLLNEQLKGFDTRTEGKIWFLADLQEYYKRLSEVESEYAKNLEKLSERFLDRLSKFKAQRKERSTNVDLWHKVLSETKNRAKSRQALSENLNNNIVNRFTVMSDDYQRISKKCREAGLILQDELCKSINELHRKLRKYHALFVESKTAESKLKSTEQALLKSEESGRKNEKMNKQKEKHQLRYSENKEKSIKAKNEYILSLQSTNKFVQTYFNKYLADLIDGFDFNYHDSFKNAVEAYASAECTFASSTIQSMDSIREVMLSVSAEVDKQQFFEDNQSTFSLPYTFNFIPSCDEEACQISPQQTDVVDFHCDVFKNLKQIKAETDEINKTVEATSDALKAMYKQWDGEMSKIASGKIDSATGTLSCQSIKSSSDELEHYYLCDSEFAVRNLKEDMEFYLSLQKFREQMMASSLKIRMEAQNDILTRALGEVTEDTVGKRRTAYHKQLPVDTKSPQAAAILVSVQKKTKIFGCNLIEYLKITGRQIPEVVESCVRFIKKFGLDHPGIFRLSGSSTDINDMKQLFECGRDPLAGLNHWKDINAVAGLLRVYFRELEDSLFPKSHYHEFLGACMGQSSEEELIKRVSNVINTLPEEIIKVMKFMFRFLTSVSDHSENNKMDAHNLAVVFGPTLLKIPSEQDMIAYQSHVNGMLEVIIKHSDELFPGESETDARLSETEDSDSDEEFETRDAEALFDYIARSAKELSFKKGDIIRVFKRFNDDWWDGTLNGTDGFVPASYIKINDAETPDGCMSPTETLPKSSSVISGDATIQRPKDLNGPPKIPKREGSLKKRHGPLFERGSPLGLSPAPPPPETTRASPQASTPLAMKQGFRMTISADDILNRQKNLRSRPKDESNASEMAQSEATSNAETPKSSTLPRNHGSPRASAEDLSRSTDDKDDVFKKNYNDESLQKRSNSLDLDRSVDESKPCVWHFREGSPGSANTPDPPSSPRSSIAPKIPPAVKPKPKGGRPNPPSRMESGCDLLASIHAAQAARTHRTSTGGSPEEKATEKRDSQGDDTQLS